MRKIAVVFPGIGYTKDRPLLYYAGKLAVANGYELLHISFTGLDWSKEKLKDKAFMKKTGERCLAITGEALSGLGDLSDDTVLFLSKSIGTVVATAYAKSKGIDARQVCFSPLPEIEPYIKEGSGILFYGDKDPLADYESIEQIAGEKKLEAFRVSGGNHSLETGDVHRDIVSLKAMMERYAAYCGFEDGSKA